MEEYIATICIFIYNHEAYIENTIKSVLNQKTKYAFKIMAIDDNSTDKTRDVIDRIADGHTNIIKVYQEKNQGLNNNVEYAFNRLDTKYVFLLGGDDYWIDDKKIEKQIDLLENNPHISYVHTGRKNFYEKTNEIKNGILSWKWDMPLKRKERVIDVFVERWPSYPCASTCCLRSNIVKEGLRRYGKLLHSYLQGEGTIIHVSLCMLGGEYAFIPDTTIMYTVRQKSLSHYELPIDTFNFQVCYFKEKIEALHLININVKREYYFFYYCLNRLLDYSRANLPTREFDNLLRSIKKEIPFIILSFFYLCNHLSFIYRINYKIQPYIRIVWSRLTRRK